MNVLVYSDLHLEFEDFVPPGGEYDLVVLAGDCHIGTKGIDWAESVFNDIPVLYVMGNHEPIHENLHEVIGSLKQRALDSKNVHFLERGIFEIKDIAFFGCTLWTDFDLYGNSSNASILGRNALIEYRYVRIDKRKLIPEDTIELHRQTVKWLCEVVSASEARRNIVISHHAPHVKSISPRYKNDIFSPGFASDLSRVIEKNKIDVWIHGHTHYSCDYEIGRTRILSNQRGYPGEETEFSEGFTLVI